MTADADRASFAALRDEWNIQPDVDTIRAALHIEVVDVDAGHAVNLQAIEPFNDAALAALGARRPRR